MTITGATEAHFLAKELAEANVGVILTPARPLPANWEKRRMYVAILSNGIVFLTNCFRIPGPPITKDTALSVLLQHGVTVGIGSDKTWSVRNLPFELAWVCAISGESEFRIGTIFFRPLSKQVGKFRRKRLLDWAV